MGKTMTATSQTEWSGDSTTELNLDDKQQLTVSAPEEFGGEPGTVTPEDLQSGALNSCYLMTFLFFVRRKDLGVARCKCETTATLEKGREGWNFKLFTIRAEADLDADQDAGAVRKTMERAKEACFVSQALNTTIELEIEIH